MNLASPDIVAIIPDRSTAYPNGVHNGLLTSAFRNNLTVEIRDVGNFDGAKSQEVIKAAIESEDQPTIYCIWPIDRESRLLMKELSWNRGVPIIQLNQLPGEDSQWEWDYLLGYAGPDDALRARNAGLMMIDEMKQRGIEDPKIVALGYPSTYGGYQLSIDAFRDAIEGSGLEISHDMPLDWGNQPAYIAILRLMDDLKATGERIHGIYAMDDNILIGAYEALNDLNMLEGPNKVSLVGTVCNGNRELLETGKQYGTTIQSPFLEAALAIDSASEYLQNGNISETIRFTPNPIATGETWESMVIPFLGDIYAADDLCTWNLFHERVNGLRDPEDVDDICEIVDCTYIPKGIFSMGYAMAGINYSLCLVCGILLYRHRAKKIVSLAQPFFLGLVLVGAAVDTTAIIFMTRDNQNYSSSQLDASCAAWAWLLTIGQMMTSTTLVAKMYRVKVVIGLNHKGGSNPSIRRVRVTTRDVSGFIFGGLALDTIILLIWFTKDPFQWIVSIVSRDYQGTILSARGECKSEGEKYYIYPVVILILHLLVLTYGNFLAWVTRKYHKVSDSRMVAICLFNSIQLLLVSSIIVALSGDSVTISYVIRVSYAFLNNIGVISLVVIPKLYLCMVGKGDIIPELHRTGSGPSSGGTGAVPGMSRVTGLESRQEHLRSVIGNYQSDISEFVSDGRGEISQDSSSQLLSPETIAPTNRRVSFKQNVLTSELGNLAEANDDDDDSHDLNAKGLSSIEIDSYRPSNHQMVDFSGNIHYQGGNSDSTTEDENCKTIDS